MKKILLFIGFLSITIIHAKATTWFPSEHVCPLCKTKNTFQGIGSYGSYIYSWPSKFQYIYWPLTDSPSVYCCLECHFATYMWDFDSIAPDKAEEVRTTLKTINFQKKYNDYQDIPMTLRLEIAEKVYKILGKDDEFWSKFYRVMGYHYSGENEETKALQSRIKALSIANNMLNDTMYTDQKKETLFVIAAMYYFTKDKNNALLFLDKASEFTYTNKKWKPENAKGLDEYLTKLIAEYKEVIKKEN
jgi:uncharacterized protein (DUF2225 family)